MKKNKIMRLASALLVLTLMTTCAISSTFAKYTTKAEGSDSARVAKWGFEADDSSIVLDDLFEKAYDNTVKGAADVIAPGTTNSKTFKFEYDTTSNNISAPEVAYTFKVDTNGSKIADSIKNNTNIQWKLDDGTWGTWDQMITAIEALDGNVTGDRYEANTLPGAFYGTDTADGETTHTISWQWLFDGTKTGATDLDTTDTEMGNANTLAEVELHINVTATQID